MRVLVGTFCLLCALCAGAAAQQSNSSADQPPKEKDKKTKNAEPAAKTTEKQPVEKAPESNASAEDKTAAKPGTDKDKEEYDVSEVPPVVTHHQITLDGKVLKYTATIPVR